MQEQGQYIDRSNSGDSPQKRQKFSDPSKIKFHVDQEVLREARVLNAEEQVRLNALTACVSQDPVMVVEFIKSVNRLQFAAKEGEITSVLTALQRMGTKVISGELQSLAERPVLKNPEALAWFEFYRNKGRRCSVVSRILSEVAVWPLRLDCQTAGSMTCVGDMLAVACFQEDYVKLAHQKSRLSLNYHLARQYEFDVEQMGLRYLRREGLPEVLAAMLNRDAEIESVERARARTVCLAAVEMVEAFDADRWKRIGPDEILRPKSALRILCLPRANYAGMYERVGRYLYEKRSEVESKIAEERRQALERGEAPPAAIKIQPIYGRSECSNTEE